MEDLSEADLADLCEATDAAIIAGGGFGWVEPQGRKVLARHFRGVLLVPGGNCSLPGWTGWWWGRRSCCARRAATRHRPFAATLAHVYLAPYARGHGLARLLVQRVEERAAALGHRVLNLDVRATQQDAIALFESLGYIRWGTHPVYARVRGQTVPGHYYYKLLEPPRGRPTGDILGRLEGA